MTNMNDTTHVSPREKETKCLQVLWASNDDGGVDS